MNTSGDGKTSRSVTPQGVRQSAEERLAETARRQSGLITAAQAREAGLAGRALRRRLARGGWAELLPGVVAPAALPRTVDVREQGACLAFPDLVVLSHLSAARRLKIPAPDDDAAWATVPAALRPPHVDGFEWVRSRHFPASSQYVGRCPVTLPARTVVDLAMLLDRETLTAAVRHVLQRRMATLEEIEQVARRLRGRAGHQLLESVLREVNPRFESYLEEILGDAMALAGIVGFESQYEIRGPNGQLLARCDFGDPRCRLAVEADGFYFHSTKAQKEADNRRDRMLARMGWVTARFNTDEILRGIEATVREIAALQAARMAA